MLHRQSWFDRRVTLEVFLPIWITITVGMALVSYFSLQIQGSLNPIGAFHGVAATGLPTAAFVGLLVFCNMKRRVIDVVRFMAWSTLAFFFGMSLCSCNYRWEQLPQYQPLYKAVAGVGFLVSFFVLGVTWIWGVNKWGHGREARRRRAEGRCVVCDYDLYMLTTDRCPECGTNCNE